LGIPSVLLDITTVLAPNYPKNTDFTIEIVREQTTKIHHISPQEYSATLYGQNANSVLYRPPPNPKLHFPVDWTVDFEATTSFFDYVRQKYPSLYTFHARTIAGAWTPRAQSKHFDSHDGTCNLCGESTQQTLQHLYSCPLISFVIVEYWDSADITKIEQKTTLKSNHLFWGIISCPIPQNIKTLVYKCGIKALKLRSRLWTEYVTTGKSPPLNSPLFVDPPPDGETNS